MQGHLRRIIAIGALAAGMMGCATTPSNAPSSRATAQAAALPGKSGCFFLRNFDGQWTALSQTELIIYAPLYKNPYLIKLFAPVLNLQFDQRLGFMDVERTGMICDGRYDDLLVPNWQPHRVPIIAVRQLTPLEAGDLLKAHGLTVPRALSGAS